MPFISALAISPDNSIRGGAAGGVVQLPFITSWNTGNAGVSNSDQVKLPIIDGSAVDFSINWGDGNEETITEIPVGGVTHTYDSEGTYTITMLGSCTGWTFQDGGDKLKILDISQWELCLLLLQMMEHLRIAII